MWLYALNGPERGAREKARHILSNKEYINHFAGNVWEWVKDDNDSTSRRSVNQYIYKLSGHEKYGPQRHYNDHICNKSNNYCGLGYYGYFSSSGGAILRGGSWWDWRRILHAGNFGGVFATGLDHNPWVSSPTLGFRCVLRSSFASNTSSEYDEYE